MQNVAIAPDLKHIVVTAGMVPNAADFLRTGTTFWIVKPRIGVGGVSGLGTLLSGAYIGLAPGEGETARTFTGLEEPPPISANVPGREFVLTAPSLGSVSPGAPIYYRGIDIGQVLGYKLNADARGLDITIFVEEPFHELIRTDEPVLERERHRPSRTGASGIELHVASLQALLIGGIEVDTPIGAEKGEVAAEGARFPLYPSQRALAQAQFTEKLPYPRSTSTAPCAGFEHRCPGRVPRHHRGRGDQHPASSSTEAANKIRIPVTIEIEPQRIIPDITQEELAADRSSRDGRRWSSSGLRAQLQIGNLLTGELFVDLTFAPGAAPAQLDLSGPVPVMPSVPATLEALQASATAIMNKIAALPIEELMASLTKTAEGLERIVNSPDLQQRGRVPSGRPIIELRQIIGKIDAGARPAPDERQRRRSGGDRPPCAMPRPPSPRSSGRSARARR